MYLFFAETLSKEHLNYITYKCLIILAKENQLHKLGGMHVHSQTLKENYETVRIWFTHFVILLQIS